METQKVKQQCPSVFFVNDCGHCRKTPKNKQCAVVGFLAECVSCGRHFVAARHVAPACAGSRSTHSEHHYTVCCGPGNHQEKTSGLVCVDCVYRINIETLGQ